MAIEIPNVVEAGGLFDGKAVPTFNPPILSSNGILPYDPATTPTVPKGGFTRLAVGGPNTLLLYLVKLVMPIDGEEGISMVTKVPEIGQINTAIPGAIITPDGNVNVLDTAHAPELGVDFSFQLAVFRIQTGPNSTPSE